MIDLLDDGIVAPIVLVVAPAGAGKTTLVADWVAGTAIPAAWLALDEADRDGVQFWSSLVAALQTLAPGWGEHTLRLLRRPGALTKAVDQLLDDLGEIERGRALLVIDDVQLVDEDDAVASSLARFLRGAPPWLHVVLLSRRRPRLPLDRLRAGGRLSEVGFTELRLSPDEATELMARLAPSLAGDQIESAVERADGWAAGLQLAALAARSTRARPGPEAPRMGDDMLVQDYVLQEAFAGEAPDLVEALMDVSIVERVNESLAHVLTGRPDADQLLRGAENRGLFVTRLGIDGWYEMHSLVRSILTAERARRSPQRLTELHTRAAQWFQEADEVSLALEQWLLADRPREALLLLVAEHFNLYDSGRGAAIGRTLAAIPPGVATADVESMIQFAWCHMLVSRRRFVELVEQATWWADQSAPDEISRARLKVLRSTAATMAGRWDEGGALARQAILDFGERWWRDPLGRFGWNMAAREVALSERWDETSDEVRNAEMAVSRDPERRLNLEGTRALGEALAGRPVDAMRIVAGVENAAAAVNMSMLRAELALADAIARREVGEREQAVTQLEQLADVPAEAMLYCRVFACVELAFAYLDARDLDAARSAFTRAEHLMETESFGGEGRDWLARAGTVLALASGDIDAGGRWAAGIRDPFWRAVSMARVHLSEGDRSTAAVALESAVPRCARHEVVLALLLSRAVSDRDKSLKLVTAAVEQAAAAGMLQTVASEGADVFQIVEQAAWRVPSRWMDRLRRVAVPAAEASPSPRRDSFGGLTQRERDIVRFLPSRLTIREIASELHISMNTLKFHLKVIYRKLGVSSRGEAAEKARRLTDV